MGMVLEDNLHGAVSISPRHVAHVHQLGFPASLKRNSRLAFVLEDVRVRRRMISREHVNFEAAGAY